MLAGAAGLCKFTPAITYDQEHHSAPNLTPVKELNKMLVATSYPAETGNL